MESLLKPRGNLNTRHIKAPGPGLLWKISNLPSVWPGLWRGAVRKAFKMNGYDGRLYARFVGGDGTIINYGLISTKLITTAFVNHLVDELQAATEFHDYKYHDSGVGVTAANVSDTDIETTDDESRATGTQTEGAANIYESVGTISYTTTKAITEHGLFCNTTGATLMDRHVFSAINVANGDSIQFTFDLTVSSGG